MLLLLLMLSSDIHDFLAGERIPNYHKFKYKIKNLPPKGEPKSISIFIGELLYISWPSLNGDIKFGTPLNNFIGVAELNITFI